MRFAIQSAHSEHVEAVGRNAAKPYLSVYVFELITSLVIPMSVELRSYFKRKCFTLILFLHRVQFVRDTRRIRIRIQVERAYCWLLFSATRNPIILGICSILNSDWFINRISEGLLRRYRRILILWLDENLRKIRIKCKVFLVFLFQVQVSFPSYLG